METKSCQICKGEMIKVPSESKKYWSKKLYCSLTCWGITRKGIIPKSAWKKGNISLMTGRKHSDETKRKILETRWMNGKWFATPEQILKKIENMPRGENHYRWKGGVTSEAMKIRNSFEYKKWRKAVFERDDYRCYDCGARSEKGNPVYLEADHIYPFSLFPQLRLMVENGRTLCESCHYQNGWSLFRKANPRKIILQSF